MGASVDRTRWDRKSDLHHDHGSQGLAASRVCKEDPEDANSRSGTRAPPSEEPKLRLFRELADEWRNDPAYIAEQENTPIEFLLMLEVSSARARSGLTQAEIAKRMGTTQSAVARLETERLPSLRTLKRYAEAVGAKLVVKLEERG
jgi:DNA-binding XRE family transcriptional regulator